MKLTVGNAMIRKNITEDGDTEVFVLKNLLTYGAIPFIGQDGRTYVPIHTVAVVMRHGRMEKF